MTSALQRIQAWRSSRKQTRERRALEVWAQKRLDGKARFVRRTALTYGLSVAGIMDVLDRVFYGEAADPLLFRVVFWFFFALVMGLSTWSEMEAKYEDALRKARAKALPDNQTLPQSSQASSIS